MHASAVVIQTSPKVLQAVLGELGVFRLALRASFSQLVNHLVAVYVNVRGYPLERDLVFVLRICKKTSTYVFPRDAAERDLASTGESVVIMNSV
ncbi:hypothetical protein LAZ67_5001796 [Cordylochernes scorpioides]|uniref:Uncharacterized protein n=1 Tax=Cordylochernes scorpioides TaxID=51811 RepID=A0ABY6KFV3_9ARAC|nr:hypothetical protein LAZ67_5001796 [Cordylochernes scorpioides]